MITLQQGPVTFVNGAPAPGAGTENRQGTIAYDILQAHNVSGNPEQLAIRFDAMASHDITYVGIIQTARGSGMQAFPIPYVLTNCHNSLCAVGGTINHDDHMFGLSAAQKYGGEFVPPHMAVIHQYMRERYAGCGRMILASDSHTRYGALGAISVGEGGPELAKQLLGRTYDLKYPEIIAVYLTGKPQPGVGPQDVALSLVKAVFESGFVKNKVLEFIGPGVAALDMDYRLGIDVMTTETTCLSSIWQTDATVQDWLTRHGRGDAYRPLAPRQTATYDGLVHIELDKVQPMIALPFHPSNAYPIAELKANLADILHEADQKIEKQLGHAPKVTLSSKIHNGQLICDQGVVAGCSGGLYQNVLRVNEILKQGSLGTGAFALSVYPASQPMMMALANKGVIADLMSQGVIVRSAFCGPCFGAGDVPGHGGLSIRHTTRNFPNREGSKPGEGQEAYVALMDARSIAATAANGGVLTAATELPQVPSEPEQTDYIYNDMPYQSRVYRGVGHPKPEVELVKGPNIADWPTMIPLPEDLDLTVASAIYDPVTTTDELIPSGETSSYRSNPLRLAEFALSRKDPQYVGRAKAIYAKELERRATAPDAPGLGSLVFALRPGDGSAREQAASCQRVLGGVANIALEYATRRYRANVVNWGMLPFILPDAETYNIQPGDVVKLRGIRKALEAGLTEIPATLVQPGGETALQLQLPQMTDQERDIILAGCLMNYYAAQNKKAE